MTEQPSTADPQDGRSIGDIVGDIATDLSAMVRSELELAKTEAKAEVTKAGKGAGMLGGAALAGYFALLFLSLFVMYLLGEAMDLQWAALIVFAVWLIAAAVLAVLGRNRLKTVDPALDRTQESLKEDVRWAKNQK
ncbi:phage holin family protein [Aeromicrobium wangtongii]|uniref:phage holin family protein n=1 Tax=Aeromicrobium wangtongii TaxID=2969247 RepID=UPI002016D327|nr:phage holin family protein [Aeromicrobium wangtongii]MCL3817532.1 phage holin family protein [Aeromicrobium wangtongii]